MINDTAAMPSPRHGERRNGFLLMMVLLSGSPCMALMFTALGPVLPSLMTQFASWGDGAFVAQVVMTMPSIGLVLAGAPNGWLVERFGGATVLRWSLACYGLAGASGYFLDSLPLFLITRFVLGFTASGVATAALALVAEYFDSEGRARVLSYQTAAGSALGFISLLAAGAAAQAWGWRAPFFLYLLAWMVMAAAMWSLSAAKPVVVGKMPGRPRSSDGGFRALKPLWPLYLLIIVVFIVVFMGAVQVSFLLAADGIVSPAVQSWILASGAVANASGALSYGWLRPRLGARGMFALSLFCMGAGNVILGGIDGVVWKVIGASISAAGAGAVGPYLGNLLLDRALPAVRGRAAGLLFSATFVGDFLNPIAVAPLRLTLGIHAAFVIIGALCLLGAALVRIRRKTTD